MKGELLFGRPSFLFYLTRFSNLFKRDAPLRLTGTDSASICSLFPISSYFADSRSGDSIAVRITEVRSGKLIRA
jgi:hypothetical protein